MHSTLSTAELEAMVLRIVASKGISGATIEEIRLGVIAEYVGEKTVSRYKTAPTFGALVLACVESLVRHRKLASKREPLGNRTPTGRMRYGGARLFLFEGNGEDTRPSLANFVDWVARNTADTAVRDLICRMLGEVFHLSRTRVRFLVEERQDKLATSGKIAVIEEEA